MSLSIYWQFLLNNFSMGFCSTAQFGVACHLPSLQYHHSPSSLSSSSVSSAKSVIAVPGPLILHVLLCGAMVVGSFYLKIVKNCTRCPRAVKSHTRK